MGMDVYGLSPKSETGEYFRANVWYWRPLWQYCCDVVSDLEERVPNGHFNDADGLKTPEEAEELGKTLLTHLDTGETTRWKTMYYEELSKLPTSDCDICSGTGQRPDGLHGIEWKEPGCNGCSGTGIRAHWATNYPFEEEIVKEFAEFLIDSGGFKIC